MSDTTGNRARDALIQQFATAVGELMLWANSVDHQLNRAVISLLALPEHAFIEPLVAQLDARPKAELLKKRARLIPEASEWRNEIVRWVKEAEAVQSNRNVVAHHRVRLKDGEPVLHSSQLAKILASLTPDVQPTPARGLPEINSWIEHAKNTYEMGQTVLANLDSFAQIVRRHQAKKAEIEKQLMESGHPLGDDDRPE